MSWDTSWVAIKTRRMQTCRWVVQVYFGTPQLQVFVYVCVCVSRYTLERHNCRCVCTGILWNATTVGVCVQVYFGTAQLQVCMYRCTLERHNCRCVCTGVLWNATTAGACVCPGILWNGTTAGVCVHVQVYFRAPQLQV